MDNFLLIFIFISIYIMLLFAIKKLKIGKRKNFRNINNCCPDCQAALNRIRRKKKDHLAHYCTFRTFNFRRYLCENCGWEGIRWDTKFKSNFD